MSDDTPRNSGSESRSARHGQPSTKKGSGSHLLRNAFLTVGTVGIIGLAGGAGLFAYYASQAPTISDNALRGTSQTQLLDSDGKIFYTTGNQKREVAKQSEIPDVLKKAVVSIEDRRFYDHRGVDPKRIMGATLANFTGSSLGLQGGSTLTQQLVKLTVFSTSAADQNLKRKAQEAYLATKLEKEYSKNQILTLYMNKVYMGNGVYGMKTAADYYFGKSLQDLTVPEAALLAGLPQSPSGYDPYTNPSGAEARRNEVLRAMEINGVISKADMKKYQDTPIAKDLKTSHPESDKTQDNAKVADAYITSTLQELQRLGYDPTKDGLQVKTNLNSKVQQRAYDIANTNKYVQWPSDDMQTGMTVTDPNNGKVIAQIGGRKQDGVFGLNRAIQTSRSSGSTAKPLVDYGPVVEHLNWPTYRALDDKPYTYAGTDIKVYNWDRKFEGPMTMRHALAQSRNIPAIEAFEAVGPQKSAEFLGKLGIDIKADDMVASNAIGIDVSTAQEAAAYSAFNNGGKYFKPTYVASISKQSGETKDFKTEGETAMKDSTAFMLTNMMKSVINDSYAKFIKTDRYAQAGKTGITGYSSDAKVPDGAASDAWFTGYTKAATISTWIGYDSPNAPGHYIPKGEEQYIPLNAYKALMDFIMNEGGIENADGSDWDVPDSVDKVVKYGKTEYEVAGATFDDPGLSDKDANRTPSEDTDAPEANSSSSSNSQSNNNDAGSSRPARDASSSQANGNNGGGGQQVTPPSNSRPENNQPQTTPPAAGGSGNNNNNSQPTPPPATTPPAGGGNPTPPPAQGGNSQN